MDISFRDPKFGRTCNDSTKLRKKFGDEQARRIRQRLDELAAAENLEAFKFLPGRCHELVGDRKGELSLDLVHPYRLIFVANGQPPPTKKDGGLDWRLVTTVEILKVDDTHD